MKTKNIVILSIAIIIASTICSVSYCFSHRYILNDYVLMDTWKKKVYPTKDVLYTPCYDPNNGELINPLGK